MCKPQLNNSSRRPARNRRGGAFTLIEAAFVTMIVSTGVLAIMAAQHAFHTQSDHAARLSTALLLANEMRELTMNLPQNDPITGAATWGPEANEPSIIQYDDLDDFDGPSGAGMTFNPPINALRQNIPDMERWSQFISVENVSAGDIAAVNPQPDNSTPLMRLTVIVSYLAPGQNQAQEVTRMTWIATGAP